VKGKRSAQFSALLPAALASRRELFTRCHRHYVAIVSGQNRDRWADDDSRSVQIRSSTFACRNASWSST